MNQLKIVVNTSVCVAIFLVVGLFITAFWQPAFFPETTSFATPIALGPVGDYIGGILNPVISLLALIWLSQSFLTQKEELLETRLALQKTAHAQTEQVELARKSTRIAALSALIESHMSEVNILQQRLEGFISQPSYYQYRQAASIQGTILADKRAQEYIDSIHMRIVNLIEKKQNYQAELQTLLQLNSAL